MKKASDALAKANNGQAATAPMQQATEAVKNAASALASAPPKPPQ